MSIMVVDPYQFFDVFIPVWDHERVWWSTGHCEADIMVTSVQLPSAAHRI